MLGLFDLWFANTFDATPSKEGYDELLKIISPSGPDISEIRKTYHENYIQSITRAIDVATKLSWTYDASEFIRLYRVGDQRIDDFEVYPVLLYESMGQVCRGFNHFLQGHIEPRELQKIMEYLKQFADNPVYILRFYTGYFLTKWSRYSIGNIVNGLEWIFSLYVWRLGIPVNVPNMHWLDDRESLQKKYITYFDMARLGSIFWAEGGARKFWKDEQNQFILKHGDCVYGNGETFSDCANTWSMSKFKEEVCRVCQINKHFIPICLHNYDDSKLDDTAELHALFRVLVGYKYILQENEDYKKLLYVIELALVLREISGKL